ncbi:hypothetical protein SFRURICE_005392 [Spodoptera frugiperda]|nr:hypothetical protein SFRURICE_005392 [Spodoptera frugiperda]
MFSLSLIWVGRENVTPNNTILTAALVRWLSNRPQTTTGATLCVIQKVVVSGLGVTCMCPCMFVNAPTTQEEILVLGNRLIYYMGLVTQMVKSGYTMFNGMTCRNVHLSLPFRG